MNNKISKLIKLACKYFNVEEIELKFDRCHAIVDMRHMFAYWLYDSASLCPDDIGSYFQLSYRYIYDMHTSHLEKMLRDDYMSKYNKFSAYMEDHK